MSATYGLSWPGSIISDRSYRLKRRRAVASTPAMTEDEADALAVARAMTDPRPNIPLDDLLARYADELAEGVDADE